jgi:NAD(P)-dependent dehydrogenase (short-subunit alcohol dehydrogenase family)
VNRKLEGRVVLVTGDSSGIGLATAQRFVAEGAFVYIIGRRQAQLDAATKKIGSGEFLEPTSVTRVDSTAWVSEGQLAFFFDPSREDLSPSLPFRIYAVPLTGEQTR